VELRCQRGVASIHDRFQEATMLFAVTDMKREGAIKTWCLEVVPSRYRAQRAKGSIPSKLCKSRI